jgi:lysophospholipase L1-like esterase
MQTKMSQRYILSLLLFLLLACVSAKHTENDLDILEAKNLQPYGRAILHEKEGLELISSAVHVGFTFEGESCQVFASLSDWQERNYLQYELDAVYQKRIKVSKGGVNPVTIAAANAGKHTVWIYKATEAQTGPVYIQKVAGKNIKSSQPSPAPLIEFIGNSITCGAASDPSEVPCGQGLYHDQHNAFYAYGPSVARALHANYIVTSVSGIGIYRNWNSDGPAMPEVYETARLEKGSGIPWDFNRYSPKIVSIALGTNDMSRGDGKKQRLPFDSAAFVSSYIQLVGLVKAHYTSAQIALLSSPMIDGTDRVLLQNCIHAVKQAIDARFPSAKPVALYFFKPMKARGCTGHPNIEDHQMLAQELQPFFQQLLNNN